MTDPADAAESPAVAVESIEDPDPSVAERAAEQAARAGCDGLASVWRLYAHADYYEAVDARVTVTDRGGGEWRGGYAGTLCDARDRPTVELRVGDAHPTAKYGKVWLEPGRTRAAVRAVGYHRNNADDAADYSLEGVVDEVAVDAGEVTRRV